MASRYPTNQPLDYCYRPIHVVDETKDVYVPCGKCNGCRLHKANEWSMRVATEIEGNPFSIFFTLTYNNTFLPKLKIVNQVGSLLYLSPDNELNVRYDGAKVVQRDEPFNEMLFKCKEKDFHTIQNFYSNDYTCYSSKRDVQLWLKLLRKDIVTFFNYDESEQRTGLFRYFIISEYGPTSYRAHLHGLIFPKDKVIAEYLIECGLYKNWQMCDKDLFQRYTHYCESGAASYVTNYITSLDSLSGLYKRNKEIKPFRLSSKSPSIGFSQFENKEVFENVYRRTLDYERTIKRLGQSFVLKYPKNYLSSIFPKCKGYGTLSLHRICSTYGRLWRAVNVMRYEYNDVYTLLSSRWDSQTLNCAVKCYKVCTQYDITPEYYCTLLEEYLYTSAMSALKYQYEQMSTAVDDSRIDVVDWLSHFYVNIVPFGRKCLSTGNDILWHNFTDSFGIAGLLPDAFVIDGYTAPQEYVNEVDDIVSNSVKLPKFNELSGNAPHII